MASCVPMCAQKVKKKFDMPCFLVVSDSCSSFTSTPPSVLLLSPHHIERRSEYEKQLVSSAIWRWPSRNINFFLGLNVFREDVELVNHMLCRHSVAHRRQGIISFCSIRFNVRLMWLCPGRYWCVALQDTTDKNQPSRAIQIKIGINRNHSKGKYDKWNE